MTPFLGMISIFGGNFAPRGWMYCNGQLLSISTNTALFSLLGTSFGGNGVSTFALPDLRGRVPVGTGTGFVLGQVSGLNAVTILSSNLPPHTHSATVTAGTGSSSATLNAVSAASNTVTPTGNYLAASKAITTAQYNSSGTVVALNSGSITNVTGALPNVALSTVGSSTPVSVMQPYLGVQYIIATQGIYPSRN